MNSRTVVSFFVAFILPVLLLVEAIRSKVWAHKRLVLTLFITIYGSTIQLKETNDGYRHREMVYTHYQDLSFQEWLVELRNILTFEVNDSGAQDVYKHVLSYFVVLIGVPALFFTLVAFVYGYFFSGSLLIVFRNFSKAKMDYLLWFFVFIFFLTKNLEGINTVRTWTGMWVLFYACARFYEIKKLKYLLLMFVPPLIHFGYFLIIIPAIIVLVFGVRPAVYLVLYLASSFLNVVNPLKDFGESFQSYSLVESKTRVYGVDAEVDADLGQKIEMASSTKERRIWKIAKIAKIQSWAIFVLVIGLVRCGVYGKSMNVLENRLLSIGILTLTLSNSTWFLTAVSNRTELIGIVFTLASFLLFMFRTRTGATMGYSNRIFRRYQVVSMIVFIPFFTYGLSNILDWIFVCNLIAPFVSWIDPELNITIKEMIRWVFAG